jgi:hypothetical protein
VAGAPHAAGPRRVPLLSEIWTEKRPVFKAVITDVFLFFLVLGGLCLCYAALRGMEAIGYPHERVARLEQLHYWAYLGVVGLFLVDLVLKLFIFLFLRKNDAS